MDLETCFEKLLTTRFQEELKRLEKIGHDDMLDDEIDKYFDRHYNDPETIEWMEKEMRGTFDGQSVDNVIRQFRDDPEYVRERIRLEIRIYLMKKM
jgi:hypothetical protein